MIEKINSPVDLKKLNIDELNILISEIRNALIEKMSKLGGHFGPNLGAIEAEVAIQYVFNQPTDKIIYDVSHQSYTHKILTGRKDAFFNSDKYLTVTGYTDPKESIYDQFSIGHTSTSIALGIGLVKARDIRNENYKVISFIGDGSLSGGEALEGLNVAGELNSQFLIILNDNEMSIAENHGGLYKNLKELRNSNGNSSNNMFKAFGLEYYYCENGNDVYSLIKILNQIKNINKPVVLHIHTEKGHGYEPSLKIKPDWHYTMPFDITSGKQKVEFIREAYENITGDILKKRIDNGEDILAITAALPFYLGFNENDRLVKYKDNFIDCGIAEEAAIAVASGAAKGHAKAVFATAGTFLQRTIDQISQDLCLDNNPATLLISAASVNGGKDKTHLGIYIQSMLSNIPNLICLVPTNKNEYISMLNWSLDQTKNSVAIFIPSNGIVEDTREGLHDYSVPCYKIEEKGKDVVILGSNDFYYHAKNVYLELKKHNINATLINPLFLDLDKNTLDKFKNEKLFVTIEGGILDGALGQKIASYYGTSKVKVKNYGLRKENIDRFKVDEILKSNHMLVDDIVSDILEELSK